MSDLSDLGFVEHPPINMADLGFKDSPQGMPDIHSNIFADYGGRALVKGAKAIDSYAGAPIRAGVNALQTTQGGLSGAFDAAKKQFGADPSTAPSGQQIARNMGVSDTPLSQVLPELYSKTGQGMSLKQGGPADPTASGAAGFAIGTALDPVSYLPVVETIPAVKNIFGAGGEVASRIASRTGNKIGKGILNAGFDIPEGTATRYLAPGGREAINSAMSKPQVAQKFADTLGAVRGDTGALAEDAASQLSSQRGVQSGLDVNRAMDLLGKFNDPDAKAMQAKVMQNYIERIGGISPEPGAELLTQEETKEIQKTLKGLADYKKPLPTAEQAMANQAAGEVNAGLKEANPEYEAAQAQLAQNMQVKQGLASKFGLEKDYTPGGSGFKPTDRTINAINDVARGNKMDRAELLQALKEQGYGDLALDIQNTADKSIFETGRPNGSRKAVAFGGVGGAGGAGLGAMIAGPLGAVVGERVGSGFGKMAGAAMDKYGPGAGKLMMDNWIDLKKLGSTPGMQKFAGILKEASQGGVESMAAAHYILSQTEPDYVKAVKDGQ